MNTSAAFSSVEGIDGTIRFEYLSSQPQFQSRKVEILQYEGTTVFL
jgi:hypothetical protein